MVTTRRYGLRALLVAIPLVIGTAGCHLIPGLGGSTPSAEPVDLPTLPPATLPAEPTPEIPPPIDAPAGAAPQGDAPLLEGPLGVPDIIRGGRAGS